MNLSTAILRQVNLHRFDNREFNSDFENSRFRIQVLQPRICISLIIADLTVILRTANSRQVNLHRFDNREFNSDFKHSRFNTNICKVK